MIIFHEGLPGAGKSYEAMVHQVLPWLSKGRKVFAYVEGLDHSKIAEILQEPEDRIRDLLIPLTREQVPEIYAHVENDAAVVIDELQNFWPAGRQKMSDEMTQFVTEHRHRGLDILAMGQDLRDCHNLWKRRISQKVVFTKLDALGMSKRYRWVVYKAPVAEKFEKIRSGTRTYDPAYFGIYASHTDDTENTDDFKDDRANIFKTKGFKYGIPASVIVGIVAVNHLMGFFSSAPVQPAEEPQTVTVSQAEPRHSNAQDENRAPQPKSRPQPEPEPLDYFDGMADKYRLRLTGLIEGTDSLVGRVEALDGSYRVQERFTLSDIEALGWTVERTGYGLSVAKTEDDRTVTHVVRPWPVEPFGRVANSTSDRL